VAKYTTVGDHAKCKSCARAYQPSRTLDVATSYTENPLVIKEVLQAIAKREGNPRLHTYMCPDCLITEITECIDRNSSQKSELSDDELFYGTSQWG